MSMTTSHTTTDDAKCAKPFKTFKQATKEQPMKVKDTVAVREWYYG